MVITNIEEIHYHKGEQNKCGEQIEFGAERNQFEKKQKWEIMKCTVCVKTATDQ